MELRLHHFLRPALLAFIGFSAFADCNATASQVVKQFPLDERTVYEIPIGREAPTTLMFPSSLTAIESANVTTSLEAAAPVLLSYTPGRTFFSVRALEANARAAVNVVWKGKTYVLHFLGAGEPLGSVTFFEAELTARGVAPRRRVSPEVLLGLLDRSKSFGLIAEQYPEIAQQIERRSPGSISYYHDFTVTLEEVFRFDPEDTLVFRLKFENTGETEVVYQPQRLAARIGGKVYYASLADASGIVPAKAVTSGYFAITGTPLGGRANLSIKNAFSIIVSRVERDTQLIIPQ